MDLEPDMADRMTHAYRAMTNELQVMDEIQRDAIAGFHEPGGFSEDLRTRMIEVLDRMSAAIGSPLDARLLEAQAVLRQTPVTLEDNGLPTEKLSRAVSAWSRGVDETLQLLAPTQPPEVEAS